MNAYAQYMSGAAKAIRNAINGGASDSDINYDVSQVIWFQIELAKVQFHSAVFYFIKELNRDPLMCTDSNTARRAEEQDAHVQSNDFVQFAGIYRSR